MTDPKRLIEESSSPLLVELLSAGQLEAPSPELVSRFLQTAALGLTTGVAAGVAAQQVSVITQLGASSASSGASTAAATSASAGGTLATGGAAAATAAAKTGLVGATLVKWVGVSVVGLAAATAAPPVLRYIDAASPATSAPPAPASAAPVRTPAASERLQAPTASLDAPVRPNPPELPAAPARADAAAAAPAPVRTSQREASPVRPRPSRAARATPLETRSMRSTRAVPNATARLAPAAPPPPAAARAPVAANTLGAELASVDRARAALSNGNAQQTLHELASYEQTFPKRQLQLEVSVLRMEAYAALGDMVRARELAARVLGAPVSPPHSARAREILGAARQR